MSFFDTIRGTRHSAVSPLAPCTRMVFTKRLPFSSSHAGWMTAMPCLFSAGMQASMTLARSAYFVRKCGFWVSFTARPISACAAARAA